MYTHRAVLQSDFNIIATFPQNENELFYMFPRAIYPLTPIQLENNVKDRLFPTVLLHNNDVVAYANIYGFADATCWLGNVIVSPSYRGKGAAQKLIDVMEDIAKNELYVKQLKLTCHNTNTRGIFLYTKLGYSIYEISKIEKPTGELIAGLRMLKELEYC